MVFLQHVHVYNGTRDFHFNRCSIPEDVLILCRIEIGIFISVVVCVHTGGGFIKEEDIWDTE